MTSAIIITLCLLLLLAYVFDLTAAKTKIPSVILLLLLGWAMRQLSEWLQISLPDFNPILPILGTVGLILIVLEGSLELELNRSKVGLIRKSLLGATVPLLVLALVLALAFRYAGHYGFKDSLLNAIPLCVISSAIAIPSVRHLSAYSKEYVIYVGRAGLQFYSAERSD
ncbi:MAG: cation:proton antiporter [Chitinophagaceae bacterium]|nr:cation:proton antiporter [Chitinophagaceae bacterium]